MDSESDRSDLPVALVRRIDERCDQFEEALSSQSPPRIEEFLDAIDTDARPCLLRELVAIEIEARLTRDESFTALEYVKRFPQDGEMLQEVLHRFMVINGADTIRKRETLHDLGRLPTGHDGAFAAPEFIGRYKVDKLLGTGGFGCVFLGSDASLKRKVAIKVPSPNVGWDHVHTGLFMNEVQVVASLDHPNIVPVFDFGQLEDGRCYAVSKFIEGDNLARIMQETRPDLLDSAELVRQVALALHHAHGKKLVHRDIKPANILIDLDGRPHVADFGLVLTETNFGKFGATAGTPFYMSPEQARGEGHLVDGRSDIFSLGIVFYELLTGERPFVGESVLDVADRISRIEPKPPRQLNEGIPVELERICLRMLAKSVAERYTTARDLADDLHDFMYTEQVGTTNQAGNGSLTSCVPKGLRSFDSADADFYRRLIPGPCDRHGIPDSLRFWKTWIEATQEDASFRVGLIYGPSGCGKSSFVKAGLIPLLDRRVKTVYLEATPTCTESDICRSTGKLLAEETNTDSVRDSIHALRRQYQSTHEKVLMVIDQFEQFLYGQIDFEESDLVNALRQCDGQNVQCLLLVRDDFWSAVSRFMKKLNIRLIENKNSAMVDLFDQRHARQVLTWFGQAYGALPSNETPIDKEQSEFVNRAIEELSDHGRIVCVKLALFAETVMDRTWSMKTFSELGGISGVGVLFLDEMFDSPAAPHEHRMHSAAIRKVLQKLLPDEQTTIKGSSVSETELQRCSGYGNQKENFQAVLRILDQGTRLLTPVHDSLERPSPQEAHYQLTHDYLVPSLKEWLTQKQRQTSRGRSELVLQERSQVWNAKKSSRNLPSLAEFISIGLLAKTKETKHKLMMRAARNFYVSRGFLFIVIAGLTGGIIWKTASRLVGVSEVGLQAILNANMESLPDLLAQIDRSDPKVAFFFQRARKSKNVGEQRRASLALLPNDPAQREFLFDQLMEAPVEEFLVIRNAIENFLDDKHNVLWERLDDKSQTGDVRFRTACVLAGISDQAKSPKWRMSSHFVAEHLIAELDLNPSTGLQWLEIIRPSGDQISGSLEQTYLSLENNPSVRKWAALVLWELMPDQIDNLMTLLKGSDSRSLFTMIDDRLRRIDNVLPALIAASQEDLTIVELTNVLMAQLMFGYTKGFQKAIEDPRLDLRTLVLHRIAEYGVPPTFLQRLLLTEKKPQNQLYLLLAIGETMTFEQVGSEFMAHLDELFLDHPDPGVHGAAEWLLRRWDPDGLAELQSRLPREYDGTRQWFVNSIDMTLVVLDADRFRMGTPDDSQAAMLEDAHHRIICRKFAISNKETTVSQFDQFKKDEKMFPKDKAGNCPRTNVDFYNAADFCNWLSKQEGLEPEQWCYLPNQNSQFGPGMQLAENYLDRKGYRLPTESEWEFAARSDSTTLRHFGDRPDFLDKYAWFEDNSDVSVQPVGCLNPNNFGMFDMLGNTREWVNNRRIAYKFNLLRNARDKPELFELQNGLSIVLRGGNYYTRPKYVRSAVRDHEFPYNRNITNGFRVVRTIESKVERNGTCVAQ